MTTFRENVRSLLRERVLDATYALVTARGWARLRLTGIAREAGISRQTLYNEFGSKEAIVRALVQRETERFLIGIERELRPHGTDLEAAARAGVGYTLRAAASNGLIKSVLSPAAEADEVLLTYLTTRPEPVFNTARDMLDAYALEYWPEVDAEWRGLAVETVLRLTVSHIMLPTGTPEESARRIARVTTRVAGFPVQ